MPTPTHTARVLAPFRSQGHAGVPGPPTSPSLPRRRSLRRCSPTMSSPAHTRIHHAGLAAVAPIAPGFQTVMFAGLSRVCALSMCTTATCTDGSSIYPGQPGRMTVWKPGIRGCGRENGVVSLVPRLLLRALTPHGLRSSLRAGRPQEARQRDGQRAAGAYPGGVDSRSPESSRKPHGCLHQRLVGVNIESRGWEYARVLVPSLRTLNGFPWMKPKVRARYEVWARIQRARG